MSPFFSFTKQAFNFLDLYWWDTNTYEVQLKDYIAVLITSSKKSDDYDPKTTSFTPTHSVVTRVSKPHAKLLIENGQWYIEHCEGVNRTYLWKTELSKNRKQQLNDGDIITLVEGDKSAR
jgi:hypothetical protein